MEADKQDQDFKNGQVEASLNEAEPEIQQYEETLRKYQQEEIQGKADQEDYENRLANREAELLQLRAEV